MERREFEAESLVDALQRAGEGGVVWSIIVFEDESPALESGPFEWSREHFGAHLLGNATGLLLSREALVEFAGGVGDVPDCLIFSAESIAVLTAARLCLDDAACAVVIRRRPGGLWSVKVGQDLAAMRARVHDVIDDARSAQRWRERVWPTTGGEIDADVATAPVRAQG